ncbi:unnamed protein product [Protopolystoma xenopodis]|uniref:Uncharacterized protein n=1 Tax=Protopolystoma xenopodis TaxID=117903 RepID=A0A3S5FGM3_9PLAT|nr:unnamed protein product [Protopolystoma xenopodis]
MFPQLHPGAVSSSLPGVNRKPPRLRMHPRRSEQSKNPGMLLPGLLATPSLAPYPIILLGEGRPGGTLPTSWCTRSVFPNSFLFLQCIFEIRRGRIVTQSPRQSSSFNLSGVWFLFQLISGQHDRFSLNYFCGLICFSKRSD